MSKTGESKGRVQYKADMRQYGGLTLLLSTLITMTSLTYISSLSGRGGNSPRSGLSLFLLIAVCILCFVGTFGMAQGFNILVADENFSVRIAAAAVFITQLTWLPFIGWLTAIGRTTTMQFDPFFPPFIPAILAPSTTDIKFIGALSLLTIVAYAAAFAGSLGFMQFCIYAYALGKASYRAAPYFRGRAVYYNGLLLLAGIAQLLMGSYLSSKFGRGPYPRPIVTPLYTVFFPSINIVVGLVQVIVGILGLLRRFCYNNEVVRNGSKAFQIACGSLWLLMLILQSLVQNGYAVGGPFIAMAPTHAMIYLPMAIMPAFLDFKIQTVAEEIGSDFYYSAEPGNNKSSAENRDDGKLADEPEFVS